MSLMELLKRAGFIILGALAVAAIIVALSLPAAVAFLWWTGAWSFELAVIVLLVFMAYVGGVMS